MQLVAHDHQQHKGLKDLEELLIGEDEGKHGLRGQVVIALMPHQHVENPHQGAEHLHADGQLPPHVLHLGAEHREPEVALEILLLLSRIIIRLGPVIILTCHPRPIGVAPLDQGSLPVEDGYQHFLGEQD